jgi:hypothetical protein
MPVRRSQRQTLRVESLETRCLLTTLNVGPNYNTNQTGVSGSYNETTIAIDPTDPTDSTLFTAANPSSTTMWRHSSDGGVTWQTSSLAGIPAACCDAQAAFDQFGNLFVTYINSAITAVDVVLSTDDGATFHVIGSFSGSVDQPSIATGPGGDVAPGSVWVDWNVGTMRAAGAPVYGPGAVGSFTAPITATSGSFGGIAVGPSGEVVLTYQNPTGDLGPATIYTDTAFNSLDGGGFSGAVPVTNTNVGGFAPIPAQPSRTIDAEANLAFDYTQTGRLYLAYTDRSSVGSADTNIYVRFSDDSGFTWSDPIVVTDDFSGNSKFNDAIAVDQSTGLVAVTWYDCRLSPTNNRAQIWGTVSTDYGYDWEPNVQIGAGLSSGIAAGGFNFGDYDTMDFANGTFYRSWGDNANPSQLTPPNTHGNSMNVATARVDVSLDSIAVRSHVSRVGIINAGLTIGTLSTPTGLFLAPAIGTAAPLATSRLEVLATDLDSAFAASSGGSQPAIPISAALARDATGVQEVAETDDWGWLNSLGV